MSTDAGRLWEVEAGSYDAAYDDPGRGGMLVRGRLAAALDLLGGTPGRILDAGMGGGRLCDELDRRGWTVHGCDASEAMVQIARKRVPGRAASLVRAPIEHLPFDDGFFDAAVALGVLEYSESVERSLGELARVVSPGGICVISFPNFRGFPSLWRSRILYPVVRAAKGIAPLGRPAPIPPRHPIPESHLLTLVGGAGLVPATVTRLGSGGREAGPLTAVQIVVRANRRS